MTKFEILDYGVYANGEHIADFDDRDYAKTFAKACVEQNEVGTVVDVICNYTGEVVYHAEKVTLHVTVIEVDSDEEEAE